MYAVCRVKKLKSYALGMASAHNLRTMPVHNADPEETKNNKRWTKFGSDENLVSLVKSRLNEVGIDKPRKDAVVAVEVFVSASPQYFRPTDPSKYGKYEQEKLDQWRKNTEKFLRDRYGENLVEMILHVDEGTPHIHAMVVPAVTKTKSKRRTNDEIEKKIPAKTYTTATLDAKSMFNKFALIKLQTDYALAVEDLGLERGMRGSKAVHSAVKQYYELVNSEPQITFKPSDILDPNIFKNLDIPLFGKDEFFKNLYKTVIKKVEKNLSSIANRYVKQIDSLTKQLNTEKDRSKWFSKRFGSPEKAQAAYENMDKKLKSVLQESKAMGLLLQTTQNEAHSAINKLETQLTYSNARVEQLEAAKRNTESLGKTPFTKTARQNRPPEENNPKF